MFALLQKHEARDPAAVTAGETLRARHRGRSPLLGGAGLGGRASRPTSCSSASAPRRSASALSTPGLVYAASGAVVDTTVVAGRVLMRGGVIEGADEVVARARERAAGLGLKTPAL